MKTMVSAVALAAALVLAAGPALAFTCPKLIAANKQLIAEAEQKGVAKAKIDQAKKLNDEAQKLHEAGKHQESVDTANKVKPALS